MTTRVAVVLATYNGAAFLETQLASIGAQTRRPDLVIVQDDASTDGTADLAREALRRSGLAHTVLVNHHRLGAARNFASALAAAEADVLFLCDQDDAWRPDKVATMLGAISAGARAAFSNGRVVDTDGRPTGTDVWSRTGFTPRLRAQWRADGPLPVLLKRSVAPGAAMAVEASLLTDALPMPEKGWHDRWLLLVAAATGRVAVVDQFLIDYRIHDRNEVGLPATTRARRAINRLQTGLSPDAAVLDAELCQLTALARQLNGAPEAKDVSAAAEHVAGRLHLPSSATRRLPTIASGLVRGRYRRYGPGWSSAAADLLSPARP